MKPFRAVKSIAALPATLTPDTLYVVRAGAGVDLYVSDALGQTAHGLNARATYTRLVKGGTLAGVQTIYVGKTNVQNASTGAAVWNIARYTRDIKTLTSLSDLVWADGDGAGFSHVLANAAAYQNWV